MTPTPDPATTTPGPTTPEVLPATREQPAAVGVAVTATGAETRSARLKGFTLGELVKLGSIAAGANMYGGKRPEDRVTPEQATMKILAGLELDIPITQALGGIDIIDGNPSQRANLMAAVIKRSGKYRFKVETWTDEVCEISWKELLDGEWTEPGPPTKFDLDDAQRAGLIDKTGSNYKRYPRSMLFARALSAGARAYCGDLSIPSYTSEELLEEPRNPETYEEYAEKVNRPRAEDLNRVADEHDDVVVDGEIVEDPPAAATAAQAGEPSAPGAAEPSPSEGSGPTADAPISSLLPIIGSNRLEGEQLIITAAKVKHLRKIAEPLDSSGLGRVISWATRDDGAHHAKGPAALTETRYQELRHFFEHAQPDDVAELVATVQEWEASTGSSTASDEPASPAPAAAASDSPSDAVPPDVHPDQGRLA